ncbi:DUF362 domain-containing protein [Desulfofalx alkaliphila]|uniref:DUF362 domain-containing protein n=1 Tax=Desulfofalx alkaliphila TaxID=105483 RepID=UPI0004E27DDF|nr:4Fe-4S binding protein [Desulfofalx alkaliphila]
MHPVVNEETCIACGTCESVCPADVFKVAEVSKVVNPDDCIECETCVGSCPTGSITLVE